MTHPCESGNDPQEDTKMFVTSVAVLLLFLSVLAFLGGFSVFEILRGWIIAGLATFLFLKTTYGGKEV